MIHKAYLTLHHDKSTAYTVELFMPSPSHPYMVVADALVEALNAMLRMDKRGEQHLSIGLREFEFDGNGYLVSLNENSCEYCVARMRARSPTLEGAGVKP